MSQESFPADNVDFNSGQWRVLRAADGDGVLDAKANTALGYPLPTPLPSSGNNVTIGPGSSRVQGFGHRVPDSQDVVIPAAVGGTQVSTIVVRYDPGRTTANPAYDPADPDSPATLGVPCALEVVTGTAGGAAPTLQANPGGVYDLPLYNITRAIGQALSAAGRLDRRPYVTGGAVGAVTAGTGFSGTPTAPLQVITERRTMSTDIAGRVTVAFPGSGFPTGIHSVGGIVVALTGGGYGHEVPGTASKTGITLALRAYNGAPLSNVSATFSYTVYGF